MKYFTFIVTSLISSFSILAAPASIYNDKFRQLDELLPSPTQYRTASGAPGHQYWQQQVDYTIEVMLNDKKQHLSCKSQMVYHNNSPDTLKYLWIQLDQNRYQKNSLHLLSREAPSIKAPYRNNSKLSYSKLRNIIATENLNADFNISAVTSIKNEPLNYVINGTMMRVDLATPLLSGKNVTLFFKWQYTLHEQKALNGRSGYEYFKADKNYLYEVAAWYPRAAAYYDAKGWQNKQFIDNGEFTLELGNYDVKINVPADHVVAATGSLQNPQEILTKTQQKRLLKAKTSDTPIFIITPDEALENETSRSRQNKIWHFKAEQVRDFAFASSRKFIWDAQGYQSDETDTMAMSFYPKEGNPLWEKYSTHAIIHTLEQYSKYTFDYPYPVAISVNGPVSGMEYPMISFNGPRPTLQKENGEKTYYKRTKYRLLDVITHEIGHNYFPMIINSDERQWAWMDEGLNTFMQFVTLQAWEEDYPHRYGYPSNIVKYMASDNQVPIMTHSESILHMGNNAYGKTATALNILRETIMGRELFDFAFKEYAQRWKYKRPTPADFFRTMEDASAIDLDWFWQGWFYTTDHVDISLKDIHLYSINTQNPEIENAWHKAIKNEKPQYVADLRSKKQRKRVEEYEELKDYYGQHNSKAVDHIKRKNYQEKISKLDDWEQALLNNEDYLYRIDFENIGGLVMPIILHITYEDDSEERLYIPAEIWRKNSKEVSKLIISDEEIVAIAIDPHEETADTNIHNNYWPARPIKSRLKLYQSRKDKNEIINEH